MAELKFNELGNGIYCVETGLYRHGLAACYLVRDGDRVAFVDTGTAHTVPALLALVTYLGLGPDSVDYVMPTHVHLDHAGGAGELMARCPNARLVVHPKGAPHMIDPARLSAGAAAVYGEAAFARDFGRLLPVPKARVIAAEDGQEFLLGERVLTFIDTPGHANHHGCIFDSASHGMFSGDTFGISYREFDMPSGPLVFAPTTPVAFDPDAWLRSLEKMMAWGPQAMFLTHYGRLDAPQRYLDALRASIRGLAALAVEEEAQGEPGRSERLRLAVEQFLLTGVRRHGCTLSDASAAELLRVDAQLNAQGLEVWLKRRAKSRQMT